MTVQEIHDLYAEWEANGPYDPVESSDDYFWAGASSFRDFLESKLKESSISSVDLAGDVVCQNFLAIPVGGEIWSIPGEKRIIAPETLRIGGSSSGAGSAAIFVNGQKIGEMHSGVCDFAPTEVKPNDLIEFVAIKK